ncbi:DUF7919 family protein [Actinoplanes awajinensis]|uniref:DUF7919 domain-containing protein n=1 Tax=Actinoplanes awajinensis subsp. mycoplanecinus TaxID=135947 RepID=A0A101JKI7_9ACTN|nr:hypothetical protein [Actinoplanes awajinensis]KUL28546.1 hypothetical protein ADL15_31880 [Actinoplanes awajinensis subsp. mycoplanecinus]
MEDLDLTPYTYLSAPLPMLTVGWLGPEYGVQGGTDAPLTAGELDQLRTRSRRIVSLCLGWHTCEFCLAADGNGEYHYYLPDGRIYAAPMMIVHYAEQHGYRPPPDLLEAPPPQWDRRAEQLCALLLDEAADVGWRAAAVEELGNWLDRRAFDALIQVMRAGGELLVLTGIDLGRALAGFVPLGYLDDLDPATLDPGVRHGIDLAQAEQNGR